VSLIPEGFVLILHYLNGKDGLWYEPKRRRQAPTSVRAIYIPVSSKHAILNDGEEKFVFIYGLNADTRRYVYDITKDEL